MFSCHSLGKFEVNTVRKQIVWVVISLKRKSEWQSDTNELMWRRGLENSKQTDAASWEDDTKRLFTCCASKADSRWHAGTTE